jgi:hypothetical protein
VLERFGFGRSGNFFDICQFKLGFVFHKVQSCGVSCQGLTVVQALVAGQGVFCKPFVRKTAANTPFSAGLRADFSGFLGTCYQCICS